MYTAKTTAVAVNAEMTLLYWQIGFRIRNHVLQGKRADYGKQVVTDLAHELSTEFGRSWSSQHFCHCLCIVDTFPDEENLSAVRRQLSWTYLKTLMYLEVPPKCDFYLQLCRSAGWSTRRLSERIKSMLYERTSISEEPDHMAPVHLTVAQCKDFDTARSFLKVSTPQIPIQANQALLRALCFFADP